MRNATLLQNAMRLQALAAAQGAGAKPRKGLVSGYDPNRYAVKVQLQPEGQETGWVPLAAEWIGNGWGMYAPPSIGDMVEVLFDQGSTEAGSAIARFFTDVDQPLAVLSGEFWLVHKNGQSVKLTNDGKLTLNDGHGASIALDGAGNIVSQATQWTHTGPVHFTDNVQVDKTLTATIDVVGGNKSLKNHPHLPGTYVAGATPVTGNSGGPT